MLIAHPFIGYLFGKIYQKQKSISLNEAQQVFWNVTAIISGIGPDIDFFLAPLLSIPTFKHRQLFTHTPLFWLLIGLFLYGIIYLFSDKITKFKNVINPKYAKNLVNVIIANTFLHLSFDLISGAIPLLWPFNTRTFTLFGYFLPHPLASIQYFTHPTFIIELALILLATYIFYLNNLAHKKNTKKSTIHNFQLKKSTMAFALIFILFFSSSLILQENSYKPYRENISFNPDFDFDNIRNSDDNDIDGNGILNIADFYSEDTQKCIVNSIENIVNRNILSLPINKQNNKFYSNVTKITPIVQNDMDLLAKILGECHFSIENDVKADVIMNPTKYGIDKINSYSNLNNISTFENIVTYIESYLDMPSNLTRGNLVITKDTEGNANGIYFVWEVNKESENIKVMSTNDKWRITITEIPINETYRY